MNRTDYPTLETERLSLNQLSQADWSNISYLRSDPVVNTYVKRPPAKSKKEAVAFINKINKGINESKWYYWAIRYKGQQELIGTICLWNFSDNKNTAEVGYDLTPDNQGKGVMNEALSRVIEFGIKDLDLHAIEAFTHHLNTASIRLLEKNEFIHIVDRIDDDNEDNMVYVLST